MTGWLLNIVGMVFIGTILEIIMPSGKTNTFIKSVFAIFLLYVIVSPIPKFFNSNISINNTNSTVTDTNYLISVNLAKISAYENNIINSLRESGYENVSVIISANIYSNEFIINKVHLDLVNLVLKNKDKHININKHIKSIVTEICQVAEEDVIIYE